jgi:hypothetical protein
MQSPLVRSLGHHAAGEVLGEADRLEEQRNIGAVRV